VKLLEKIIKTSRRSSIKLLGLILKNLTASNVEEATQWQSMVAVLLQNKTTRL
jgi:hypothetical protein